jgi:hypothetical protein
VSMGSVFSDFSAYLVPALLDRATNRSAEIGVVNTLSTALY